MARGGGQGTARGGNKGNEIILRYANICDFGFASRLRLDPATTTDWNTPTDYSGNYNCIEPTGDPSPSYVDSHMGRVLRFVTSGTPTKATLTKDFGATDPFWIHLVIRFNATGTDEVMVGRGKDGSGNGWSVLFYKKSTNVIQLATFLTVPSSETVSVDGATALEAGRWYTLDGVFTPGTGLKVYVNGVEDGSTANTKTSLRTSTVGITAGYYNTDANGRLNADIARFTIGTRLPDASLIKTMSMFLDPPLGHQTDNPDDSPGGILGPFGFGGAGYGWIPTVAMAGGG